MGVVGQLFGAGKMFLPQVSIVAKKNISRITKRHSFVTWFTNFAHQSFPAMLFCVCDDVLQQVFTLEIT